MKAFGVSLFMLLTWTAAAFAQGDVHKVDFKNFTYLAQCISETPEKVTVKNGEFSQEKQEDGYVDRFYFQVFDIAYGDLSGDPRDEAIVLTVCNTGGTGNFSEGFVFGMKAGKPTLIARIPGGDRAYGGLRKTRVERGLLVVESSDVGEMGGACCPEYVVTTRYKVTGGKLQKIGIPTRVPIDPPERITFSKGSSGSTFKINVPGGESKKFVARARAGQTLSVSLDVDNATLRMISKARVTEGIKNFRAVLPKNGDFTFEVINESATGQEINVNVKIH